MELLFTLDSENYTEDMPVIERYAVRGMICKDGLWAMQRSKSGEYKIPGGGMEPGESTQEALVREVLEETGLHVLSDSIKEIGEVLEIRKDNFAPHQKYVAHSYYYFCEVDDTLSETAMTANEIARGYRLEWADLDTIIACNEDIITEDWQLRDQLFFKWLREHLEE